MRKSGPELINAAINAELSHPNNIRVNFFGPVKLTDNQIYIQAHTFVNSASEAKNRAKSFIHVLTEHNGLSFNDAWLVKYLIDKKLNKIKINLIDTRADVGIKADVAGESMNRFYTSYYMCSLGYYRGHQGFNIDVTPNFDEDGRQQYWHGASANHSFMKSARHEMAHAFMKSIFELNLGYDSSMALDMYDYDFMPYWIIEGFAEIFESGLLQINRYEYINNLLPSIPTGMGTLFKNLKSEQAFISFFLDTDEFTETSFDFHNESNFGHVDNINKLIMLAVIAIRLNFTPETFIKMLTETHMSNGEFSDKIELSYHDLIDMKPEGLQKFSNKASVGDLLLDEVHRLLLDIYTFYTKNSKKAADILSIQKNIDYNPEEPGGFLEIGTPLGDLNINIIQILTGKDMGTISTFVYNMINEILIANKKIGVEINGPSSLGEPVDSIYSRPPHEHIED